VICTPGAGSRGPRSFASMVAEYEIHLTEDEESLLGGLPPLLQTPVGSVHLALEAKATMTAHIRALPRLDDELTSSHNCIHGASKFAIAGGLSIINIGDEFISPKNNPWRMTPRRTRVNTHNQPKDALRTIEKIKSIARRSNAEEVGFDALGIIVIEMRNDGSTVRLVDGPPSPPPNDIFNYDSMIRRIAHLYEARFPHT